jgi:hypothetical protein
LSERFGTLRSLLHGAPDRRVWLELCAELERWPKGAEVEEVAVPYARDILTGWPPAMLAPPDGLQLPPDVPWVGLVRRVSGATRDLRAWARAIHGRGGWIDHLSVTKGAASELVAEVLSGSRALEHLSVERGGLGLVFVRGLARQPLPSLRTLSLDLNPLGDEGCYALAKAPWLPGLEELSLSQVGATDAGAASLLAREYARLHTLDLSANGVGDAAARALCVDGAFEALRALDLSDNGVGDEGAMALEEAMGAQLEALDLSYNRIGPRVVTLLERAGAKRPGVIVDVSENTPPPGYVDPFGEDDDVEEVAWRDWERADDLDEWETWTTWKRNKG